VNADYSASASSASDTPDKWGGVPPISHVHPWIGSAGRAHTSGSGCPIHVHQAANACQVREKAFHGAEWPREPFPE
jgi:hypothetical protein